MPIVKAKCVTAVFDNQRLRLIRPGEELEMDSEGPLAKMRSSPTGGWAFVWDGRPAPPPVEDVRSQRFDTLQACFKGIADCYQELSTRYRNLASLTSAESAKEPKKR